MNTEEINERRLAREAQERKLSVIRSNGATTDCARVEVSFIYANDEEETDHCGWFEVHCGPEGWAELDEPNEEYHPHIASHILVGQWFDRRESEYSWWQIDEINAY